MHLLPPRVCSALTVVHYSSTNSMCFSLFICCSSYCVLLFSDLADTPASLSRSQHVISLRGSEAIEHRLMLHVDHTQADHCLAHVCPDVCLRTLRALCSPIKGFHQSAPSFSRVPTQLYFHLLYNSMLLVRLTSDTGSCLQHAGPALQTESSVCFAA